MRQLFLQKTKQIEEKFKVNVFFSPHLDPFEDHFLQQVQAKIRYNNLKQGNHIVIFTLYSPSASQEPGSN